jgi:hypothetical protein
VAELNAAQYIAVCPDKTSYLPYVSIEIRSVSGKTAMILPVFAVTAVNGPRVLTTVKLRAPQLFLHRVPSALFQNMAVFVCQNIMNDSQQRAMSKKDNSCGHVHFLSVT